MTVNEMEINKFLWCNACGIVVIESDGGNCNNCGKPMTDIGFVEDKQYNGGGSVEPGLCQCGQPRANKGRDKKGRIRYRTQCYKCLYAARIIVKSESCNICGIKPEDKKQLHKDHIDGNRSNNSVKNIQTLCVDCHKYKTKKQEDWKKKNGN